MKVLVRAVVAVGALGISTVPVAAISAQENVQPATAFASLPAEAAAIEARMMRAAVERDQASVLTTISEISPFLARQLAAQPQMQGQLMAIINLYGQPSGWEVLHQSSLGTSIITRFYAVRHEQMVIVWRITYIRTTGGWTLGSFLFNDQIDTWISLIERDR